MLKKTNMSKFCIQYLFIFLIIFGFSPAYSLNLIQKPSLIQANSGRLFTITESGQAGNVNLNLCLNAKGLLSCESHTVSALTLNITSNLPNKSYTNAGIIINTPGYSIANSGLACTPNPNGYCLFSVSDIESAALTLTTTAASSLVITPATFSTADGTRSWSFTVSGGSGGPYVISSNVKEAGGSYYEQGGTNNEPYMFSCDPLDSSLDSRGYSDSGSIKVTAQDSSGNAVSIVDSATPSYGCFPIL
jgi:hypothetical protein